MQHPGFSSRACLLYGLLIAATLAAGGCVYRMNIQQGNYLDPKVVDQLQLGMTRSQVRYLLGTPMVPDAFDRDRWDYLYFLEARRLGKPERRLLTVYFEGDKVARVEREGMPATASAPPAEPGKAGPRPAEARAGAAPAPTS